MRSKSMLRRAPPPALKTEEAARARRARCIPCIDERIQDTHELSDVRGVKAGRRLIENVERAATRRLGKLVGKLDALCFAARQCVRGLSQGEIAESNRVQQSDGSLHRRDVFKEDLCIGERHLENLMDVLVPKAFRERLFVEPAATTALAMHVNVREKAHLHFDRAGNGEKASTGISRSRFFRLFCRTPQSRINDGAFEERFMRLRSGL